MATFVLVPGAGGQAWYWHRLVPELESRGHRAIAVELPAADPTADLNDYAGVVIEAIGDHAADPDLVVSKFSRSVSHRGDVVRCVSVG